MDIEMLAKNIVNHIFAKDLQGRYLFCNEYFASVAGLDSPQQVVGKVDYDLCWPSEQADFFRAADQKVVHGESYINQYELILPKKIPVIVTKTPIFNKENRLIGIIGSSASFSNYLAAPMLKQKEGLFYLDSKTYLTQRELEVLKYTLLGYSNKRIAESLSISARTVETHLQNIKLKLQCNTRGELIITAVELGLFYLLKNNAQP